MFHTFVLFLLLCCDLQMISADVSPCLVFREDNPYLPSFLGDEHNSIRVDYCISSQKCCKTGCCPKETVVDYLFIFAIVLSLALTLVFVFCKICCKSKTKYDRETRSRVSPIRTDRPFEPGERDEIVHEREYGNSEGSHVNLNLGQNEKQVVHVQVEDKPYPGTPPPSYDAITDPFAPSAPPETSIPLIRPEHSE